jgi:pilus assembly protein Flp/PilA
MFIKMWAFKEAYVQPYIEDFKKDLEGATAIEYGLIAGGISLAIVAAVFAFGGSLKGLFSTIAGKMGDAAAEAK